MDSLSLPSHIQSSIILIVFYALLILVSKLIKGMVSSLQLDHELTSKDNNAVAVSLSGYFIGVTIIYISAVDGPHESIWYDLIVVGGYSLGGIIALNISRVINEKLMLYKFSVGKEIVESHNTSAGVVEAAFYIASSLVIAGAIHGEGGSAWQSIIFFIIGLIGLLLFGLIYVKITTYSVHDEIKKGNLGAGLGLAGGVISIGIIMMKAIEGEFESWSDSFMSMATDLVLILVYLIFVRFFFDKLIIPKSDLNKEIANDKNIGAGLLEMMVSISFSTVLYFAI